MYFEICKSLRGRRSTKKPETSPDESALRIAPVCDEPLAAREQGPRDQRKNPGGEPDYRVTVLICTHLPKAGKISRLGLYGIRRSASTVRQVQPAEETIDSAARKDAGVKTRIGERDAVRAATREP